ncbi:MAG: DOMON-like domain-containing protein [Betaproteobacteria bacterium]
MTTPQAAPDLRNVALVRHQTTPCSAVHSIDVEVRRTAHTLALKYLLEGDIGKLAIPIEARPKRADQLWRRTCFEAFIAGADGSSYYEFNFSPSREYAVYAFSDYREEVNLVEAVGAPQISVRREDGRLRLDACIALETLSAIRHAIGLRVGLSAVIEAENETLSYWALNHPSTLPDFHHADGFSLSIP